MIELPIKRVYRRIEQTDDGPVTVRCVELVAVVDIG